MLCCALLARSGQKSEHKTLIKFGIFLELEEKEFASSLFVSGSTGYGTVLLWPPDLCSSMVVQCSNREYSSRVYTF